MKGISYDKARTNQKHQAGRQAVGSYQAIGVHRAEPMDIVVDHNEKYGVDMFCHVPHGTCRLTISPLYPSVLWVSSVIVDKNHRKQGIGTHMLKEVEKVAADNGCKVISLQTWVNSFQQKWYARHGYIPVAEGYDADMVMMSKMLS